MKEKTITTKKVPCNVGRKNVGKGEGQKRYIVKTLPLHCVKLLWNLYFVFISLRSYLYNKRDCYNQQLTSINDLLIFRNNLTINIIINFFTSQTYQQLFPRHMANNSFSSIRLEFFSSKIFNLQLVIKDEWLTNTEIALSFFYIGLYSLRNHMVHILLLLSINLYIVNLAAIHHFLILSDSTDIQRRRQRTKLQMELVRQTSREILEVHCAGGSRSMSQQLETNCAIAYPCAWPMSSIGSQKWRRTGMRPTIRNRGARRTVYY